MNPPTPPRTPNQGPPAKIEVTQHIPLVHQCARKILNNSKYLRKSKSYARQQVEYDDVVGYGMIGLCRAAERFDVSRGLKFSTFATYLIRGAILDGIREMTGMKKHQLKSGIPSPVVGYSEDMGPSPDIGLDPSDDGESEEGIEDTITVRQLLENVPTPTAAAIDRLLHVDSLTAEADRLGVSRTRLGQIKRELIKRVKKANR